MDNSNVVKDPLTPGQVSDTTIQEVKPKEEVILPAQPGSKTEPTELLKSLQEEREKRRLAEEEARLAKEELDKINSSVPSDEAWTDEGKLLDGKVKNLSEELSSVKSKLAKQEVLEAHPELKDKWQEFEEFRQDPENKGMNLKTAAKAFLTEKGFLEPKRQGLENPTGGPRTPMTSGTMTVEEVKHLRTTNYRKYVDMLKKGLIKMV